MPLLSTLEVVDIGAKLVKQGHAWSYRYIGAKGAYDAIEAQARQARKVYLPTPKP